MESEFKRSQRRKLKRDYNVIVYGNPRTGKTVWIPQPIGPNTQFNLLIYFPSLWGESSVPTFFPWKLTPNV